jgi:hypothetical protein
MGQKNLLTEKQFVPTCGKARANVLSLPNNKIKSVYVV